MADPAQHHTLAAEYRRRWRARIRRVLKHLPRRSNLARYPVLKYFRRLFHRFPFLWSYRAPESLRAVYLGSVVTFLPIMGAQILVGAVLSLPFRANITIVSALQLVSNPLTGPGMYYLSYVVGRKVAALSGLAVRKKLVLPSIQTLIVVLYGFETLLIPFMSARCVDLIR